MKLRIKEILKSGAVGSKIQISAWVRTQRQSKNVCFLSINDGSCLSNLQVVCDQTLPEFNTDIEKAKNGSAVQISGEIVASLGKGQAIELRAESVKLLGESPDNYPLQKKGHSFEFLREISHLRPRSNTFGAVFRLRSRASHAVHQFFQSQGFVHVHTPIITASDCEGAGQMFQVTTLDIGNPPRVDGKENGAIDFSKDFFEKPSFLTVSGQLEGELFASGLGDIYTFGPTFRAENSNTPRHLAEFWMIEPEMAFCDLAQNMQVAEDFIKFVISDVLENCAEDLAFFDERIEKGLVKSLEDLVKSKFSQLTYTEAISILEKSGKKFEFPVKWGVDLQTEHERFLSEEYVKGPVTITNYPKDIKAFYMHLDDGEKTVSAMDMLVPRLGEIIGGSQRESRLDVLSRRIKECGLSEETYWWYLDTRRFGTMPHAGFGLGFERLIMYITGMTNIRDVIPFPRTPGNAEF